MKATISIIVGASLAVALLFFFNRRQWLGGSVAQQVGSVGVKTPTYDCGEIVAGERVTHDFKLLNGSSHVVYLRLGPTSCGCTVASLKSNVLRPGDSASIDLAVDTTGRHGGFEVGVPVVVDSDVEGQKREDVIPLTIRANVSDSLGIIPSPIQFGDLREGTGPVAKPFKVVLADDGSLVKQLDWSEQFTFIKATLSEPHRLKGKIIYDGVVTVDPDLSGGRTNYSTFLQAVVVRDGNQKVVQAQIYGWIVGHFSADPKILFWDSAHNAREERIVFDAVDGGKIEVIDVKCRDQNALHWRLEANGSSKPCMIVVRPTGVGALPRTELKVSLREYGSAEHSILSIPVLALQ